MTIITMGFIKLTAGEAVDLKDGTALMPVWLRASDIAAIGQHFFMQTWGGRTYATPDGAVIHCASLPGMPVHVRETPEQVIEMLAEAGE